ncbi:hypothetical protein EDD80_101645 [Anseongella ginsenosidimutans]|uniref:HEAT repeat protein n=1 Tax=Anseongella ginsenosidimutans TaxID=496056 RepID=A0A4R3KYQ3_9SPHI|nr:hypothetical protein [Anseongella ginsenosidimutans]QEC50920.1 hypothetical protein FRZ59_00150 [Anseongella ginsenosidimutans]TCS90444.1 hypothetical protein EDD80_101645 [Anseongella ginsenosidimutans]
MDLRSQLLQKHDKQNMLSIREYIADDEERFGRLMELFFSEEYRIQQRASWAVMHCADRHPHLVRPYLERMIGLLDKPVHDSVKRNTVRILRDIDIPEALYGKTADNCFRLLTEPAAPAAVKAFSMYVLLKIVKEEPELAPELRLLIQETLPTGSAAIQAAAGKVLRQLNRLRL